MNDNEDSDIKEHIYGMNICDVLEWCRSVQPLKASSNPSCSEWRESYHEMYTFFLKLLEPLPYPWRWSIPAPAEEFVRAAQEFDKIDGMGMSDLLHQYTDQETKTDDAYWFGITAFTGSDASAHHFDVGTMMFIQIAPFLMHVLLNRCIVAEANYMGLRKQMQEVLDALNYCGLKNQ